jgi:hypothetical protein
MNLQQRHHYQRITHISQTLFYLYHVFLTLVEISTFAQLEAPTGTNALSQGLADVISHPPGTNTTHLYRAVATTGTNVRLLDFYRS